MSCVLPVKNYSEELELDQDTDILLFSAVEQMLNYADSFFENQVVEDQDVNNQLDLYSSSELLHSDLSEKPVKLCERKHLHWINWSDLLNVNINASSFIFFLVIIIQSQNGNKRIKVLAEQYDCFV